MLGSTTVASPSVREVSNVSLIGPAEGYAMGGGFSSEGPSFDDDESSESGDRGCELESDSPGWARFAFAGAYRADNIPSTTLRNFNG